VRVDDSYLYCLKRGLGIQLFDLRVMMATTKSLDLPSYLDYKFQSIEDSSGICFLENLDKLVVLQNF
jgi:hypothetical protein